LFQASREGCRMSKRSMLKLFEEKRAWTVESGRRIAGTAS
jgi:hypothetical protein